MFRYTVYKPIKRIPREGAKCIHRRDARSGARHARIERACMCACAYASTVHMRYMCTRAPVPRDARLECRVLRRCIYITITRAQYNIYTGMGGVGPVSRHFRVGRTSVAATRDSPLGLNFGGVSPPIFLRTPRSERRPEKRGPTRKMEEEWGGGEGFP